jgi:signal transduction histidine kinase
VVDAVELIAISTEGARLHLSSSARPLEEGAGVGAVVTFRDISRERATQEQLMLSDRMASVGMLAAGVAHEINNPLAAVVANLDLTNSSINDSEHVAGAELVEVREMLADARTAADRVRQIVRDLKIFARHEEASSSAVDVKRTLESSLRMAWNEIRHRATVIKDYGDVPRVRGSESRLGQVFLNLLVNAAHAIGDATRGSEERGLISLRTRLEGSDVVIEIEDDGPGIPEAIQARVFEPFFTTKPPGKGTGQGLAIARSIVVEHHGGTLAFGSAPGKGTLFTIRIPAGDRRSLNEVAA